MFRNNTQLGHDKCALKLDTMESMSPGVYQLNGRTYYDSCGMVFPGYIASNQGRGILASTVDTESELKTLNYLNSKCPEARYNPYKNCNKCEKCNSGMPCGCRHCKKDPHDYKKQKCNPQLIPKFTRDKKTCNATSSLNINRFEPLCLNLQKPSRIQSNDYIGTPTRNVMKDMTTLKRKTMKEPVFNNLCNCKKFLRTHSSLDCLYKKDTKRHTILPIN